MNVSSDGFWRPDVRLPFITDGGETVLLHYTGLVEHPPGLLRRAMNAAPFSATLPNWLCDEYQRKMRCSLSRLSGILPTYS
jgi:hypothetical protein